MATRLRVDCDEDCANAPNKQLLKDFAVALAEGRNDDALSKLGQKASWELVGRLRMDGPEAIARGVPALGRSGASTLEIESILTDGKAGAVNGRLSFEDGHAIGFCDVIHFGRVSGASIARVTSYQSGQTRPAGGDPAKVVERIKEYVGVWTTDKRMRVAGEVVLREIARIKKEEGTR